MKDNISMATIIMYPSRIIYIYIYIYIHTYTYIYIYYRPEYAIGEHASIKVRNKRRKYGGGGGMGERGVVHS